MPLAARWEALLRPPLHPPHRMTPERSAIERATRHPPSIPPVDAKVTGVPPAVRCGPAPRNVPAVRKWPAGDQPASRA